MYWRYQREYRHFWEETKRTPKETPPCSRAQATCPPTPAPPSLALLNARLADGLDLRTARVKVAHWNIKGPLFPVAASAALRPSPSASPASTTPSPSAPSRSAAAPHGTARHVAAGSTLPEYPPATSSDLAHVRLLAERFDRYLAGLHESRRAAEKLGDTDTVDLFTQVITEFEKNAWFLRASLDV